MNNRFLAKSNPEKTIEEHTIALLQELENLKGIYPTIQNLTWDLLEKACIYHDYGKINTKFQNKIMPPIKVINQDQKKLKDKFPHIKEIPHGYLSCAFIPLQNITDIEDKKILLQSVYYHHNRPKVEDADLKKIVNEDLIIYYQAFADEISYPIEKPTLLFKRYVDKRIRGFKEEKTAKRFIMVKGLLNRIDHAASAGIPVEIPNPGMITSLGHYFKNQLKSELNELQQYMKAHQDHNNIIIASTGIGKTEGALYWIGNEKGFFTLPLRVSINAIYDRICNKIAFREVALLHSETESEYNKLDLYSIDYYEQTKQWTMPLTICTLDQILDFVFKQEGFEKKLATLAYSKLIIDEIQMYSPKMLACLLFALKEISEIGGKFTIMTATFAPFIADLMEELKIKTNRPNKPFLKEENGQIVIRHRVVVKNQQLTVDDILANIEDRKILVIVNTVDKAQELYKQLKNRNDLYLFHGRFIKKNRKAKENAIMEMGKLKNQQHGIWITTQVVEASVDIDFDVLYTELSDLNGLFQRMGRVYRGRALDHDRVNVYVYSGGDEYPSGISSDRSIIDKCIFDLSKEELLNYQEPKIFTEEMKMDMIENVYSTEKLEESDYYKEVKAYLGLLKNIIEYEPLNDKIMDLRGIFNETIIPKTVYKENMVEINDLIDQYKASFKVEDREKARKLRVKLRDKFYGFTVDIPRYRVSKARYLNRYEQSLLLGDYTSIPIIDYEYDSEIGLRYTNELKKFDLDQFS